MTYGLFNFAGMSASVVAPLAAALIGEAAGDVAPAFVLAAALLVVGAIVLWRFGGTPAPRSVTAAPARA